MKNINAYKIGVLDNLENNITHFGNDRQSPALLRNSSRPSKFDALVAFILLNHYVKVLAGLDAFGSRISTSLVPLY